LNSDELLKCIRKPFCFELILCANNFFVVTHQTISSLMDQGIICWCL
jgi:hypothetical protein